MRPFEIDQARLRRGQLGNFLPATPDPLEPSPVSRDNRVRVELAIVARPMDFACAKATSFHVPDHGFVRIDAAPIACVTAASLSPPSRRLVVPNTASQPTF